MAQGFAAIKKGAGVCFPSGAVFLRIAACKFKRGFIIEIADICPNYFAQISDF